MHCLRVCILRTRDESLLDFLNFPIRRAEVGLLFLDVNRVSCHYHEVRQEHFPTVIEDHHSQLCVSRHLLVSTSEFRHRDIL